MQNPSPSTSKELTENLQQGVPWILSNPTRMPTTGVEEPIQKVRSCTVAGPELGPKHHEIFEIWEALKVLALSLLGRNVLILSDNSTIVAYLNKQVGTRSLALCHLAARTFKWVESNVFSLSAVHLKGKEHVVGDFLS